MPPSNTPRPETRRARLAIRAQRGGHPGFRGKRHARSPEIHQLQGAFGETPQAAVEILRFRPEKNLPYGESTGLRMSHHEIVTFPELPDKEVEVFEIIAIIGVAHDSAAAVGDRYRAIERGAIAPNRNINDAGTKPGGNFLRTIGGPVVADRDFAAHGGSLKVLPGFPDTGRKSLRLIQAGHNDAANHSRAGYENAHHRQRFSSAVKDRIRGVLDVEARDIERERQRRALSETVDLIESAFGAARMVRSAEVLLRYALDEVDKKQSGLYPEFGVYRGASIS